MPLQNFVANNPPTIKAAWLNLIDAFYVTLFQSATTAAAARTALGVTSAGDSIVTAANAAAQRTALGSTTVGDAVFTAVSQAAAQSALGVSPGGSYLALAGGTMIGPINETMATVASHATTADIWGSSASDVIDWTGTATTTAFPNAPVAGARRLLRCAGACAFTAGANLVIIGMESGGTVTMQAGALVEILATSTTAFELRYTLSGTFTATMTGYASPPTKTWSYTVTNAVATVTCLAMTSGTSNSTGLTITGFPAQITPNNSKSFMANFVLDNNTFIYTAVAVLDTGGTLSLSKDLLGTGFTASGVKNGFRYTQELTYRLGGNF